MAQNSGKKANSNQSYKVLDAVTESVAALQYNLGTVAAIVAIGMLLSLGVLIVVVVFFAAVSGESIERIDVPGSFGAFVASVLLGMLLFSAISSFLYSAYSKLTQEGTKSRKIDVSRTIEFAKSRAKNVFFVNMYTLLIVAGPLFASGVGLVVSEANDFGLAQFVFGLAALASMVWTVVALLRFALAAHQVAVFEDIQVPKDALARSRELMDRSSRWFFFKLIVLAGVVSFALEVVFPDGTVPSVILNLLSVAVGVVMNGALTLLYFRRVAETKSKK